MRHKRDGVAEMVVDDLLATLIEYEDRAPREFIDECARHGRAMVDALDAHVGPAADWSMCASEGHWWMRIHAAFILGLMEEEAAGQQLVHLMRRLAADPDDEVQDWLAGHWPALFRNKPDSIFADVEALAWEHHAHPYMRSHAVEVLLAAAQRRDPEALDACLARTAEWVAAQAGNLDETMLTATVLLDFPRPAYRALLERLVESQVGSGAIFSMQEVESAYAGQDSPSWLYMGDPWGFYSPERIEARQKRWAEEDEQGRGQDELLDLDAYDNCLPSEPYVRDVPKIGRNDPCPCGSGRKYKKCCLNAGSDAATET
ncbi:MAG: SEC-C metal-binding domain-containing protein [Dokdonella sp.]|uniref:SEC-C metal-binding domain-containing protein n=2 Tax=Dokdonella sp. TaxID=2291710 RepID=UPI003BB08617